MASAPHANGNGNGFIARYGMIVSTVGIAIVAIGGFWGAVINPIAARMEKLEGRLETQHLTIREHDEFKLRLDRENSRLRDDVKVIVPRSEHEARWLAFDKNMARIEDRFSDAQKLVVPRDELMGRLVFLENNFKLISDRLSTLREAVTAPYPVREQIDRLTNELVEQRRAHGAELAELRRQLQERQK